MEQNREIDQVIAEEILGYKVVHEAIGTMREEYANGQTRPLRSYTTDIGAAWDVATRLGVSLLPTDSGWFALIGDETAWRSPAHFIEYLAKADFVKAGAAVSESAPMAICLAAVRWIENAESRAAAQSLAAATSEDGDQYEDPYEDEDEDEDEEPTKH